MPDQTPEQAPDQRRLADHDLAALVTEWLDWAQVGKLLGVTPAQVRTMVREHELAAAVPNPGQKGAGQRVPALFIQDGFPVKGLPGLLTMLHDGRFDDRECIAWLFLDQGLPGRPIDALRENRGSEVKRRAQAMAL
ncbi:Rv2175c family DNA-binding protein [Nocardioides sp. Iso805N]|uniref:Rv2175c family DNA-binding protein n=1 Tax=Nocardioides sp. Iso805N TaxID=1283287 RepID=UPI000381C69B|nr:Rv2175c family DNA-binding protein [Nocardioides sp. Iso805N]